MAYNQRPEQARTDTTRHLNPNDPNNEQRGVVGYMQGARQRSERFAESTAQLREIRTEIDTLGREAIGRPTGVLSGGDVDIAYHYLGMGIGVAAALYSIIGTIFALHGGSETLLAPILEHWATGPATAVTDVLLNVRTLVAVVVQVVLFVIIIGTRRNPRSWQHWAALIGSTALTYAGWSSFLLAYGLIPMTSFTLAIPAALVGGALAWGIVWATSESQPARPLMIGVIVMGVLAGMMGITALIHWVGLLLAWSADQVARRIMVVG